MTTLLIAIVFLLVLVLAMLGFELWVLTNVRDDQLVIRTWIAKWLKERGTYAEKKVETYDVTDDEGNLIAKLPKWKQPGDEG